MIYQLTKKLTQKPRMLTLLLLCFSCCIEVAPWLTSPFFPTLCCHIHKYLQGNLSNNYAVVEHIVTLVYNCMGRKPARNCMLSAIRHLAEIHPIQFLLFTVYAYWNVESQAVSQEKPVWSEILTQASLHCTSTQSILVSWQKDKPEDP